jgi:hypothetical protein
MGSKSYSKGISWIDDCRIPFVDGDKPKGGFGAASIGYGNEYEYDGQCNEANTQGRFPANLLVSDDMLNDGIKPNKGHRSKSKVSGYGEFGGGKSEYHGIGEYMNVDSTSRYYDIDKWFDNLIDV